MQCQHECIRCKRHFNHNDVTSRCVTIVLCGGCVNQMKAHPWRGNLRNWAKMLRGDILITHSDQCIFCNQAREQQELYIEALEARDNALLSNM